MKQQRSLKNLFVRPAQQLKFSALLLGLVSLLAWIFVCLILGGVLNEIQMMNIEYQLPPDAVGHVKHLVITTVVVIGIASVIVIFGLVLIAVTMSHKIFGPLIPIEKLIEQLRMGNYTARGALRKGDHMTELMENLNQLGRKLQERHGPKAD